MKTRSLVIIGVLVLMAIGSISFYIWSKPSLKGEIASVSQWKVILPGNWNFEYEEKTDDHDYSHKGEIEFAKDGSFKLYVNIKDLEKQMFGELSAGGDVDGLYFFENDSTFVLAANKTNIDVSRAGGYSYTFTKDKLNEFYNSFYFVQGYFKGQKLDILQFNQNKIAFAGKRIDNDADIHYIFSKESK